jgi:outer membrane protein assembly factor BamB
MKRYAIILLIFILVSTSFLPYNVTSENQILTDSSINRQYEKGFRYNIQGWIYLYIEGEPYERGYQHGYLLSNEIVDMINRWSNMIHNQKTIKNLNKFISEESYDKISETWWNFCKKQSYNFYRDKYEDYPEYKNEIQGIADGVKSRGGKIFGRDVTYQDILACNEMYELLSKITQKKLRLGFHPILTLFKNLKEVEPLLSKTSAFDFFNDFCSESGNHKCNGFIAAGDATPKDEIVISNSMWSTDKATMWWWSYYITFRWSIILDINPTNGNRIIMASVPSYIWSDHDYYQNDRGIVLLETTCHQGLWDNKGLPLAIRARRAMQYGNSVDEVMKILKYRNDGAMNAVWLIGDAKTNEIVRFEIGYRNSWYNKTSDGFYWSANNPFSMRVRLEKFNLKELLKSIKNYILKKSKGYVYYTLRYFPTPRDLKYEELGKKYYGNIDIDIVKLIMSTEEIVIVSPDCKITDSHLLKNNGLWVFLGNPAGSPLNIYDISNKTLEIKEIPPLGWARFFGLPEKKDFNLLNNNKDLGSEADVLWNYNTQDNISNTFTSSSIVVGDVIYSTTSSGELYALNRIDGSFLWNLSIGEKPTVPVFYDNNLFIGTKQGLMIVDLETNERNEKILGKILSKPVIADGRVFVGNENGDVYALDAESEEIVWHLNLSDEIYISEPMGNVIFINSGKSCYAVDINSGDIIWSYETDGVITSRPYVFDDVVYFGSWDTFIYALQTGSGDLKWKYETGWGIETTPIVSNGIVYVGSLDSNFYAIDKDSGEVIWFFTSKAAIHSSPIVYGEYVFFGCDDGRFYALNKTNGNSAWVLSPGYTINNDIYNYLTTPILSTPVVFDSIVYIGANGDIYALDAETFEPPKPIEQETKTNVETWFFIILLLIAFIIIAVFYLYCIKREEII